MFRLFSVLKENSLLNHINHRHKSSASDGNILTFKTKIATREKMRKYRALDTNVTQGM